MKLIHNSNIQYKTVIDLCSGSCSVAIASACFGYNSISIDIDENQIKCGVERLLSFKTSNLALPMKITTLTPGPGNFKMMHRLQSNNRQQQKKNTTVTTTTNTLLLNNELSNPSSPESILSNEHSIEPPRINEPLPQILEKQQDILPTTNIQQPPIDVDNEALHNPSPQPSNTAQKVSSPELKQTKKCSNCPRTADLVTCNAEPSTPVKICRTFECVVKHFKIINHASSEYLFYLSPTLLFLLLTT